MGAFRNGVQRTMQGSDTQWTATVSPRSRTDRPRADGRTAERELLIVDPGVDDIAILLAGLRDGVDVLHLAADGRGFEQIAGHLAGRRGVPALHIICRGEPGCLLLAGTRIDLPAIAVRYGVLADIACALDRDAKVVLYACSVGADPAGSRFLDYLEVALGTDVAAASRPVGARARCASWELRDRRGDPVRPAFTPAACAGYPGLLAAPRDDAPGTGPGIV